jgi:hypothetical protein
MDAFAAITIRKKDEPHCTRLTAGGNCITYAGNKSTPTANLVTAKLLINSTILTSKAKFYGMDLSNFYLMTPMKEYKYMCLCLDLIPNKIVQCYNLHELVNDKRWVYLKIQTGMYGLLQAGILANKLLEQRLNAKGYYHCQHTPRLWSHVWQDIILYLVVDDFGIKTTSREHVIHLKDALKEHYTVTMDWDGSLFCGINIDWNYPAGTVNLNMPKYIPKALLKFQHPTPDSPQHQPYKHAPIQYGARVQRVVINTSAPLSPDAIKRVQNIVGTLLYYGRAVDPTLLTAQCGAARRNTIGAGGQNYADIGVPNGGLCKCRSQGVQDCCHQETHMQIRYQPLLIHGTKFQLDKIKLISKFGFVVPQRRKRNAMHHCSQHSVVQ